MAILLVEEAGPRCWLPPPAPMLNMAPPPGCGAAPAPNGGGWADPKLGAAAAPPPKVGAGAENVDPAPPAEAPPKLNKLNQCLQY